MSVKILVILALLCAAQLNGVQVQLTGEIIFPTVPGPASFTLNGPNFSLAGRAADLSVGNPCFQGCSPGDIGDFDAAIFWDTSRLDSATVDGVTYSDVFFGDAGTDQQSQFHFRGPSFTVTESLVYTAPVTIEGFLIVYSGYYSCVICDPPTDDIDPTQPPFPLLVTGSGLVTMTLREATGSPSVRFVLDRIVYQLVVPEPSAFFLVSAPFAIVLIRRLLRSYF